MEGLMDFDKLNVIKSPEDYFSSMDITNKQYDDRVSFSKEYKDIVSFIFSYIEEAKNYAISYDYLKALALLKIIALVEKYTKIDDYLNKQINFTLNEIIRVTRENIDTDYYLSDKRAWFVSVDQSNTILNHADYVDAVKRGRTKKRWIDVKDNRERQSHLDVGGTELDINDLFVVGNSFMLYPKDGSYGAGAEEIVNCRCSIIYF